VKPALNYVGAEVLDVKAVFQTALYGCVRDAQIEMLHEISTDTDSV
jgi:hypothetical protein